MQPSWSATRIAVVLITVQIVAANMNCQDHNYCSLGKLAPFVGDLYPSAELHKALQLRGYKQEVIIMVSDTSRLDSFLQAAHSLEQLGLRHILLLSYSQEMCKAIAPMVPDIGCGWSSHKHQEDLQGILSIRLGYNVLMMDSDVVIMDDPYKYFKHPPFKDITVLNQEESPSAHSVDPNGGLVYVQNAAPDGPAAFMFAEVVLRPFRWADDGWEHASRRNISKGCLYADQDTFADVLPDMASGYMLFPKALGCLPQEMREEEHWQKVQRAMVEHAQHKQMWRNEQLPVPDSWQVMTNGSTTDLRSLQLRMPNCRGWPEELGGQWYPPERGPYSTDFLQQLANDAPDLPLWPDHENSSNAAAADRVPTEQFAFMPHWLGIGYWLRGRKGFWDPNVTGNIAQQVIAHAHFVPNAHSGMAKRVVLMSLNRYNWDLQTHGSSDVPYFACEGLGANCSTLKVLAFTPSMEELLASSASWHEFAFLLQGLAALGTALRRAVAWPSLPCNTSWVSRGASLEQVPLKLGDLWLPWSTAEGDLMCTPWPYVNRGCLSRGRGILPWEYQHMRRQLNTDSNSTIHAVHDMPTDHTAEGAVENEDPFALARGVVEIDAATEVITLQELQDKPILLLDNLVHAAFSKDTQKHDYEESWQECIVLNITAYTAVYDLAGNDNRSRPMTDLDLPHQPARLRRGKLHRHNHVY